MAIFERKGQDVPIIGDDGEFTAAWAGQILKIAYDDRS